MNSFSLQVNYQRPSINRIVQGSSIQFYMVRPVSAKKIRVGTLISYTEKTSRPETHGHFEGGCVMSDTDIRRTLISTPVHAFLIILYNCNCRIICAQT